LEIRDWKLGIGNWEIKKIEGFFFLLPSSLFPLPSSFFPLPSD